jgi:predicted ATPase
MPLIATKGYGAPEAEAALARARELCDQVEDAAGAEACFERAIRIARRQSAKSLQLRATASLARLWLDRGRRSAARDLLAPVYAWFTEGFDTPDLRQAKELLETLG